VAVHGRDKFRLAGEVRYIQRRAADHTGRVIRIGQLILFSTKTGDAWLLDPSDRLAARLARDGDPEPIHIEETDTTFAIGWKGHYRIEGPAFVYLDRDTGRTSTILSRVRWFSDIRLGDVATVGGKTASLGELYCALSERDIKVPNGFALTAQAYRDALSGAQALEKLHGLLDDLDKRKVKLLAKAAAAAREIVYAATGTTALAEAIAGPIESSKRNTAPMSRLRSAVPRRPRICRPRASPASTKASSMFAVHGQSFTHVGAALRRSSQIAQASITSRWRSRSV
jgi:hypothetical protein